MSYPPPPGTGSLPPRPPQPEAHSQAQPPSRGGFKPAFSSTRPAPAAYSSPSIGPSAPAPPSYSSAPTSRYGTPSYSSAPTTGYGAPQSHQGQRAPGTFVNNPPAAAYSYRQHHQPQQHQQQHSHQGPQGYGASSYGAAPHIQNPFQPPSAAAAAGVPDYAAEEAAQIAEWQSAYSSRDPATIDPKDSTGAGTAATKPTRPPVEETPAPGDKKKTVMREGGGKKWQDDTLADWDPSHLRLFVGNLAGETTDDSLLKAFSRWKSVQKARVVRDKRSTKSKGYGFVSFSDADDFFQAAREMNGKYIQSHPVVVKKANTEIKVTNVREERGRGGKKSFGGKGEKKGG